MAQAGGGHSGLRWINSDALVTPRGDYQMKRKEQTRHSAPLHCLTLTDVSCLGQRREITEL